MTEEEKKSTDDAWAKGIAKAQAVVEELKCDTATLAGTAASLTSFFPKPGSFPGKYPVGNLPRVWGRKFSNPKKKWAP